MYRDSFIGTTLELKEHITSLKLPDELPAHEAIRAFMLAHAPKYGNAKWHYTVTADSADNAGGNRLVGFISVSASEV